MADTRRYSAAPQLDIEKILVEANSRWLRPAEICEILRNYKNFRIAPEAPNRPPSGMLFLFDKKVLRYFRKDGHNWRKKKDGKTVKEAHEKLKDGSVDVLHCYYAHGEDDEKFQRRTYWMLEEDYSHIVLVHYREVKGNKLAYGQSTENEETSRHINMESPASSNSMSNHHLPVPFSAAITESPNSSQTYEYEDAESADNHQASSRYHPHFELQQFERGPVKDVLDPYFHHATSGSKGYHPTNVSDDAKFQTIMNGPSNHQVDLPSWDRVLEHCAVGSSEQPFSKGKDSSVGEVFLENLVNVDSSYVQDSWQVGNADGSSVPKRGPDYSVLLKQLSLDIPNREGEASLKKYDSFTTWMSKEFDEVEESRIQTGSSVYWDTLDSEGVIQDAGISHNDAYIVGPSLSQDQLYSILDISPNWSSTRGETKVRVTGKFLMDENEASSIMWSCMFGEVEVPAEVSGHGVLMCCAPQHKSGRVPFYVTCSNRLACSEIREFEYAEVSSEVLLHARFEELLSLEFEPGGSAGPSISGEKLQLSSKIVSLLRENDDEWSTMLMSTGDPYPLHERVLKEKLLSWLSFKIAEEGKGPAVLDKEGQGIVHLAAALGYDWAIAPTIIAGVSIDFRDIRGWTALHWAAFCGREKTVGVLFSLGAAPGVLTDPTPEFPSGRTPADLASANGHKGIAGFLAESSLTKHLCTLTLKEMGATNLAQEDMIAGDVARTSALPMDDGNMEASLSAFRNAAQAAARIHQVYRVQSFQRKKLEEDDEYGDDRFGMSNAQALSMLSVRSNNRAGQHAEPVAAAIQIQKKFRGWKGRRDFLTIRQNVVKIQALVRGHQVRRHYKKIVWTVGIVEKAILRWRRKRTGLRSFKPEGSAPSPSARERPIEEDDYDFLKEGQKQTEARLVKALDRVKSMVQYPEARDQYRRLLTVVEDLQESRAVLEKVLNDPEVMESEPMFDIDELLGDDPYMAIT